MAQYFGFEPGTYQPWALNLAMDALGQPGVARGMLVTPASPASMNVLVAVDAVALDGVAFLPNGGWCRIDAAVTLSVPNNTSGSTRQDAVVIQLDPTGVNSSQIVYVTGWNTGFGPQAYGTPSSKNNELVLALVSVPNNAASIAAGNIVNTPQVAAAGTAPQNYTDAVIGSEFKDPHGTQPGTFVAIEIQITASASNGQTSFAIPLTNYQRLVPQGRIGGALEVGDFAGPNGWYWPKLRGSVSGLLPIASVDSVGGNLNSAVGAQSGEAIFASYKYYDFSRDAKVRSGPMFLEKTSPYLVYQGEVIEDRQYGPQYPLWDGSLGAYLLLNVGESVFYTDYIGNYMSVALIGGPGGTSTQVALFTNGTPNFTQFTNTQGGPPGATYGTQWVNLFPPSANGPCVYQLKVVAGFLGISGVRNNVNSNSNVFVSGGLVNVVGQPVLLSNTSFALPSPSSGKHASYTIYTDRFGNITNSIAAPAGMERILGRVPIAGSLQFGGNLNPNATFSASYGSWALPNSYLGWPVDLSISNNTLPVVTSASMQMFTGWNLVTDPQSPNGAYLVSSSPGDSLMASAVCTGMDLLMVMGGAATTALTVAVDTSVNGLYSLFLTQQSAHSVRITLFSNLPYGTHTARINTQGSYGWGVDAIDIRVPATPAPPPNTLPLAQVDVFGFSSTIRPSFTRGTKLGDTGNNSAFVVDAFRPTASPAAYLTNFSSSHMELNIGSVAGTGGFILHYQAGPDKGIIDVASSNTTIDAYSVIVVPDTTALCSMASSVNNINISSSNTRNVSSSAQGIFINAIELFPWFNAVTDLRHFGTGHGHASELRSSTLLGQKGERLDDGALGLRDVHFRDRSITSRKLSPTWSKTVASTAYSGFSGSIISADPNLSLSVSVEVPSILAVWYNAGVRCNTNQGVQGNVYVNGSAVQVTAGFAALNAAGSVETLPVSQVVFYPVPAGTHLVQTYLVGYGGTAAPYFDTTVTRSLNVLAFAL